MDQNCRESVLVIRAWVEPGTDEPRVRIFEVMAADKVNTAARHGVSGVLADVELWLERLVSGVGGTATPPRWRRDTS